MELTPRRSQSSAFALYRLATVHRSI